MGKHKVKLGRSERNFVGAGGVISSVLNKAIDLLPVELHIPGGYKYCGPGTKLKERLARGDVPLNGLDDACRIHDIAYSKHSDSEHRRQADKELAERAWRRFKASDSSIGEKAAAWAVTTAMKVKTKIGGGKKKKKQGRGLYLKPYQKKGAGRVTKKQSKKKKKTGGGKKKRCCKKKRSSR